MSQTCWGDFRLNLCLPKPRGGRRWTRLVPQFDVLQFSSKSGLWEAISWQFFVLESTDIRLLEQCFQNPRRFTNRMLGAIFMSFIFYFLYLYSSIFSYLFCPRTLSQKPTVSRQRQQHHQGTPRGAPRGGQGEV